VTTFFCLCGAPYKNGNVEVNRLYMNRSITVTKIPGYVCSKCGNQRVPTSLDKRINYLFKNSTPDKEGNIEYTPE
jgi:YgiT-type zinc finger domain-containing protein